MSSLSKAQKLSVFYHDIFDYPLTRDDLEKWIIAPNILKIPISKYRKVESQDNFFFLKGRKSLVKKRLEREKLSKDKLILAENAVKKLIYIPTIKFIGLTGSLAMKNADKNSDIDLLIITSKNTLWTSRLFSKLVLFLTGFKVRRPKDLEEKDKLCLNMWMDEEYLAIENRNIFTAHEIAQIVPLLNRDNTYEKFVSENKWALEYWPRAVARKHFVYGRWYIAKTLQYSIYNLLATVLEPFTFRLQYIYMKSKITRETVTRTRAFFHPVDWSEVVIKRLTSIT